MSDNKKPAAPAKPNAATPAKPNAPVKPEAKEEVKTESAKEEVKTDVKSDANTDTKAATSKSKELPGDTGKIKSTYLSLLKMNHPLEFRGTEEERSTLSATKKVVSKEGVESVEVITGAEAEKIRMSQYYQKFGRMIEKDMANADHSEKNAKAKVVIKDFILASKGSNKEEVLEKQKLARQSVLDALLEIYKLERKAAKEKVQKVIEPITMDDWLN